MSPARCLPVRTVIPLFLPQHRQLTRLIKTRCLPVRTVSPTRRLPFNRWSSTKLGLIRLAALWRFGVLALFCYRREVGHSSLNAAQRHHRRMLAPEVGNRPCGDETIRKTRSIMRRSHPYLRRARLLLCMSSHLINRADPYC